jgi:HD domain-containing protein
MAGLVTARPVEGHWHDRPVPAALLRAGIVAVPFAVAVGTGLLVGRLLPTPHALATTVEWWTLVLAASGAGLVGSDAVCRRLLPLAVLLELSLLFPDRAPSRFRTALRSGSSRHLQELLEEARKAGVEGDPTKTAGTILSLVAALGAHHRPSQGHSERVRAFVDLIAEEMRLPTRDRHRLRWAALLHDVGKVAVPLDILDNTGDLRTEQWTVIRRHPEEGRELVAPLRQWLGQWAMAVEQHHERWDGLGYPAGLQGEEISLGGRIVCVADSFEAMTARRSYQTPMTTDEARTRLAELSGTQFDPAVVRSFLNVSVGRVRWALGPLAVLAQVPVLGGVARAARGVALAGSKAAAVAATAAAVGMAGGPSELGTVAEPPTATVDTSITRPAPTASRSTAPSPDGGTSTSGPSTASQTSSAPSNLGSGTSTTGSTTTATSIAPPLSVPTVTVTVPPVTVTVPTLSPVTVTVPPVTVPKLP